jgi:ribosomal protein L37E
MATFDALLDDYGEAAREKGALCTHRDPEGDNCSHQQRLTKAHDAVRGHVAAVVGVSRAAVEVIQDARAAAGLPKGASLTAAARLALAPRPQEGEAAALAREAVMEAIERTIREIDRQNKAKIPLEAQVIDYAAIQRTAIEKATKTLAARLASPLPPRDERRADDFTDVLVEVSGLIRAVAKGYEEGALFTAHDSAKRLYRMGYRKVAAPELDTCRRCGAENVVTSQAVCLACVGEPSSRSARPVSEPTP